jgi:putative IMPACT (imprinted ancient) family translation regulator
LGNAVIVVTRYFGGTLLGTGGLVKAYSQAAKKVVEIAARAELVAITILEITMPYRIYELFLPMAQALKINITHSDFSESVRISCEARSEGIEDFRARLDGISSGSVKPRVVGERLSRCAI